MASLKKSAIHLPLTFTLEGFRFVNLSVSPASAEMAMRKAVLPFLFLTKNPIISVDFVTLKTNSESYKSNGTTKESALKYDSPSVDFSAPLINLISRLPDLEPAFISKCIGRAPPCVEISARQIPETGT